VEALTVRLGPPNLDPLPIPCCFADSPTTLQPSPVIHAHPCTTLDDPYITTTGIAPAIACSMTPEDRALSEEAAYLYDNPDQPNGITSRV
jgi:hypothetical protein